MSGRPRKPRPEPADPKPASTPAVTITLIVRDDVPHDTPIFHAMIRDLATFCADPLYGEAVSGGVGTTFEWMGVDLTVSAVGPEGQWVQLECRFEDRHWQVRLTPATTSDP